MSGTSSCLTKCQNKCAKQQQKREKHLRCIYVIQKFPLNRNMCLIPSNDFRLIYKNKNETTMEQLASDFRPCMNYTFGLFMDGLLIIMILMLVIKMTRRVKKY